jgi:uncharacterized protein (DUF1499 family)
MKTELLILACGVLCFGCAGTPPGNPGIKDGRLQPCPDTPNCVVSQNADPSHHIEPIRYDMTREAAFERLKSIVQSTKRARIVDENDHYLRAEYTSLVFRFVDDVEFYLPDEPVIHVRSASRLGYSDLGVNRKRIEDIRSRFHDKQ